MTEKSSSSSDDGNEDGNRDPAIILRRGETIEVAGRRIYVRPAVIEVWERLIERLEPFIEPWLAGDMQTFAQLIRQAPKQVAEMLAEVCEDEQGERIEADWFRQNCGPNELMDLVEAMERVNELVRFLQRQREFAEKFAAVGRTPST